MKALLSGVLCAGLLGQAPVWADATDPAADVPALGHASLSLQQDDADGESLGLALALPVSQHWYLNASAIEAENVPDVSPGTGSDAGRVDASSRRFGVSLERDGWGGSLSRLNFDDGAVLATDETQLLLRHRGTTLELALELAARSHDVVIELPNRTLAETFDSRGFGLHLSVSADNGVRGYGGWQQYDYDDAEIFDATFLGLLRLANQYPLLREQILRTYESAIAQQNQAEGSLARRNLWLGIDFPIKAHVLTLEHFTSEAELDGSNYSTDTAILALNLSERWGLDLSAGLSRGDAVADLRFVGVAAHWFW